jgi:hypothetical protein
MHQWKGDSPVNSCLVATDFGNRRATKLVAPEVVATQRGRPDKEGRSGKPQRVVHGGWCQRLLEEVVPRCWRDRSPHLLDPRLQRPQLLGVLVAGLVVGGNCSGDGRERVFVVISDAFRFEVAQAPSARHVGGVFSQSQPQQPCQRLAHR